MDYFSISETLYTAISVFSLLLLVFMLYNNIVLYKMSFKDKLSIILLSTIVLSIFDIIWHFIDGNADYKILNYACGYAFAICLSLAASLFTLFSLEQFNIQPTSKKLNFMLFALPNILIILACLSTPWTALIYTIDGEGKIQYMDMFNYGIAPFCILIMSVSPLLAVYNLIIHRKNPAKIFYARSLLIFAFLVITVECVQEYVLEINENYLVTNLAWAIGFTFFSTSVNTERFVRYREKISAVETDLRLATNIQLGALPAVVHALPRHQNVNVYATMNTAKEVGGDFYDFFEIDDTHIGFVIADVSGKGVPAALFMMTVKTMIRDHATMKQSTAQIFTDVNKLLCESNPEEMFATAWIGILDTTTKKMTCTNAGHNAPCFAKLGKKFEYLRQRHGTFLAGFDFTQYKESEIQFESGDCLFLYTDGLTEAHNTSAELYGEQRLLDKLNTIKKRGGEPFLTEIANDVAIFSEGTEQFDDITMMVIRID